MNMNRLSFLITAGKVLVCGTFAVLGLLIGGSITAALGLPQPPLPQGMDTQSALLGLILQMPLLAMLLALLARHLAGNFAGRALMLAGLTWICNALNNQIEASVFAGMGEGFLFTIITFLFPSVFAGLAVAWLFPKEGGSASWISAARMFLGRFSTSGLLWRTLLGAVLFMPIYYFFGLLVIPFTMQYYAQHAYGLEVPPLDHLLVILLIRSVLFFLACAPIVIGWQGSRLALFWRLGLSLFYLVGFQSLIIANWMPWALRLPHMLEILLDEMVYAGALSFSLPARKE